MTVLLTKEERQKNILFYVNSLKTPPLIDDLAKKFTTTPRNIRRDCKDLCLTIKQNKVYKNDQKTNQGQSPPSKRTAKVDLDFDKDMEEIEDLDPPSAPANKNTPQNLTIDESFQQLIAYLKHAQKNGVDINAQTVLTLLQKTDQLQKQAIETYTQAELVDYIEENVKKILNHTFTPKELDWLYD